MSCKPQAVITSKYRYQYHQANRKYFRLIHIQRFSRPDVARGLNYCKVRLERINKLNRVEENAANQRFLVS